MHQIIVRVQGGEGSSLAEVLAALDLAKGRLAAGMSNGTSNCGDVFFEFEAREVDMKHAFKHLLPSDSAATGAQQDERQDAHRCLHFPRRTIKPTGLQGTEMDEDIQTKVAVAGELLIRAAATLGTLSRDQQLKLGDITEGNLTDCLARALQGAASVSPSVAESLQTHGPSGFIAMESKGKA